MEKLTHLKSTPQIGQLSRIAQQSIIVGNVVLGQECSVWPYATIRGDVNKIVIGNQTNIQENVVIHVSFDADVTIGDKVTIGHGAIIHGCHIDSTCLIGMHATILDGAKIGHHCIVGANTLVTQNKEIPPYSLVLGNPGKVIRTLTPEDIELIEHSYQVYVDELPNFPF